MFICYHTTIQLFSTKKMILLMIKAYLICTFNLLRKLTTQALILTP